MKYPNPESVTLEFKKALPKNNQIVKTVVGLCNQKGGKVIVGIEDDGTILGLSDEELTYALDHLDQKIVRTTTPSIRPHIYAQNFGEKTVLIIEVSPGMNRPYYITSEKLEKGTYIRLGRNTFRATVDIIQDLQLQSRGLSYDCTPCYSASLDDLDFEKINHFFKNRKGSGIVSQNSQEALRAYKIVVDEHGRTFPTIAGILMFGKNTQKFLPEKYILCSQFRGNEGREVAATKDCSGTLIEQLHEAYYFVLSKLERHFSIKTLKRDEKYEIPEIALREAILNCLMHRNYLIQAPIKIAIYNNRVEIFSPGVFPGPIDVTNLRAGLTYTRNYGISKLFREAGFVEKLGTGLTKIFSLYAQWGLSVPHIFEGENFVKYILPRPGNTEKPKAEQEDTLLNLFNESQKVTVAEIVQDLRISRTTALRRLRELIKKGIVEKKGSGPSTIYHKK